jgi:hypothetical protein
LILPSSANGTGYRSLKAVMEGSIPPEGAPRMPRANLLRSRILRLAFLVKGTIIRDCESRVPGSNPGEGAKPFWWNGNHARVRSVRSGFDSRKRHWVDRAARRRDRICSHRPDLQCPPAGGGPYKAGRFGSIPNTATKPSITIGV